MGKTWASPAEIAFLDAELPAFLTIKADDKKYGKRARFLADLYVRYFAQFPMPEVDESGKPLRNRMAKRRNQIQSRLDWAATIALHGDPRRSAKTPNSNIAKITKALQGKQGRCAQEIEIYQKEQADKLNPKVANEIARAGATSRKEKMEIRRQVTQTEYANEPEAVKTVVRAEYEKQKEAKKDPTNIAARPSEDTAAALDNMPSVLGTLVQHLAEQTGWTYFIATAGPNPRFGGKIFMRKFFFGPNLAGQNFEETYPNFREGLERPFAAYANACFSTGGHEARVINIAEPPASGFETSPPTPNNEGGDDKGNEVSGGPTESDHDRDSNHDNSNGNANKTNETNDECDVDHDGASAGEGSDTPQPLLDILPPPEPRGGPSDPMESVVSPENYSQLDYSVPGASISSPLAASTKPARSNRVAASEAKKRKAVEDETPVVTGKRIRKATRAPDGKEYQTSGGGGAGGRGARKQGGTRGRRA